MGYENFNIRHVQLKCLEILDVFHRICVENNIQYSLCGGSVVGAHLYKAILSWDDDVDVMMTRENFERFHKIAPALLPDGYALHSIYSDAVLFDGISKLMDERTTYVENKGKAGGVFVDITCYDRVPLNPILRKIDYFFAHRMLTALTGHLPGHGFRYVVRNVMLTTVLANTQRYIHFANRIFRYIGRLSKRYTYSELLFCGSLQDIVYSPHIFENYTDIEFEGKHYMVVRDYVDYLVTRYNRTDFHEPKEKRVLRHLAYVNLDLPYQDYLKSRGETQIHYKFKDNKK